MGNEHAGFECQLFFSEDNVTWSEVTLAKDVTLKLSASVIDVTSRATDGWKSKIAGLREWGVTTSIISDYANAGYISAKAHYLAGTVVYVKALDKYGEGIKGAAFVTDFGRGEPLEGAVVNNVTVEGNGTPTWVDAGSGS